MNFDNLNTLNREKVQEEEKKNFNQVFETLLKRWFYFLMFNIDKKTEKISFVNNISYAKKISLSCL